MKEFQQEEYNQAGMTYPLNPATPRSYSASGRVCLLEMEF